MHHQRGFTMVELIVVLVLVGILGAIGAVRFFDRRAFDADAFTEQTRAMLRYAQKEAIAQNRDVFVRLDGGGISLCFADSAACAAAQQVLAPGGANTGTSATRTYCGSSSWYCEAPPQAVSYTASVTSFHFDALGRPFNSASPTTSTGLLINITGDGATRTVSVSAETGYVF